MVKIIRYKRYMRGLDLQPFAIQKVNNSTIYEGQPTQFYKPSNHPKWFSNAWTDHLVSPGFEYF